MEAMARHERPTGLAAVRTPIPALLPHASRWTPATGTLPGDRICPDRAPGTVNPALTGLARPLTTCCSRRAKGIDGSTFLESNLLPRPGSCPGI